MAIVTGPPPPGTRIKQRRMPVALMVEHLARTVLDDVYMPRGHDADTVDAVVNCGRWIARCPDAACGGAELVAMDSNEFFCLSCFNHAHDYRTLTVNFPDNALAIEVVLLTRPHLDFMSWEPGETLEDLAAAGPFHRSWTAPRTWTTGEIVTASILNTHVRDNLLETAVAKATAIGLPYASGVNALTLLAASGNGGKFIRFNAGATAVEAASVTSSASSLEWANRLTDLYEALFGAENSGGTVLTGVGALQGSGWRASNMIQAGSTFTTASAGDMNAADDDEPGYIACNGINAYLLSPRIIGGRSMLQAIGAITGKSIATITVGMMARAPATTADAADAIGISNDADAALGTAGTIGIINGAVNFEYRNGAAAAVSLGVAKDTNWHLIEYVINIAAMTMDIKLDGTTRASAVALAQDEWPKGVWLSTGAAAAVKWQMPACWVKFE